MMSKQADEELRMDAWITIYEFKKLVALAERIARK